MQNSSYLKTTLMDANKILSADVLDILFEGRNKSYGAYDLRKTYGQRLGRALLIMFSLLLLIIGANFLFGFINPSPAEMPIGPDVILQSVESPPPPVEKIIPPPPKPPAAPAASVRINTTQFTTPPIIEKDPPEDQRPPEMTETENTRIGTANITDGKEDDGLMRPEGNDKGKGIIEAPKKEDDGPVLVVEIESKYPGGPDAWRKFLERNLFNNLPQDAVDQGIEGSVLIRFVVDVDGTVSDITVMSGPKEYQQAAVNAIRKSGKWTAAIQNGRKVKSYKMQAITVKLQG